MDRHFCEATKRVRTIITPLETLKVEFIDYLWKTNQLRKVYLLTSSSGSRLDNISLNSNSLFINAFLSYIEKRVPTELILGTCIT